MISLSLVCTVHTDKLNESKVNKQVDKGNPLLLSPVLWLQKRSQCNTNTYIRKYWQSLKLAIRPKSGKNALLVEFKFGGLLHYVIT